MREARLMTGSNGNANGAAFHVGCAVFMGLNCFLWSFVATYPAIALASASIALLLRLR